MTCLKVEEIRKLLNLVVKGGDTTDEVTNFESFVIRQGKQMTRLSTHLEDYVTFVLFTEDDELIPFKESINCPKKEKWPQVMFEEWASLDKNHVGLGGASYMEMCYQVQVDFQSEVTSV